MLGQKTPVILVAVGRKGIDFMRRYGREMRAEFSQLGDRPSLLDTLAYRASSSMITPMAMSMKSTSSTHGLSPRWYRRRQWKSYCPSNRRQVIRRKAGILITNPTQRMSWGSLTAVRRNGNISRDSGVNRQRTISQNGCHAQRDGQCGRADSRFDPAYNKARQEAITTELLDISGGAAALAKV